MTLIALLACQDNGVTVYHEPPAVNIFEPAEGTLYYEEQTVEFRAQVETINGSDVDTITHRWVADSSTICQETQVPADGIATYSSSFDTAGEYKVTVTATDPRLDRATDTVVINIAYNNPPEVTLHEPLDGEVLQSTDLVVFLATLADAEDEADQLEVQISSSQDGVLAVPDKGTTSGDYSGSAYLTGGSHLLTVQVTDTAGKTGQATATVRVNDPPDPPEVELSPDPAGSGESLVATITSEAVDPEGDAVTYRYDWYVDGAVYSSGTVPTVAAGVTQRSEYWEVFAYPYDGQAYGNPGSDALSIGNTAPSIDSVTLTPTPLLTLDDGVCTPVGWDDPEGDAEAYRYAWYHGGTLDKGQTTSTYPYASFVKGDTLRCEVTPYDDYDDGDSVSSPTVTIENTAPTQPTVTITPASPEPEDTLVCTVKPGSSTDDDGDSISFSYAWVQNGSTTSYTSASVSDTATAHNDIWECLITPSDGEDDGTYGSDTVTVTDVTAPDAPVISSIDEYRNDEDVALSGTCEASCTLTWYISDSTGSWTETSTCTSGGAISHTTYVTRGYETEIYATCTDAASNTSSDSNTVTTEACDPEDTYENTTGYGDTSSNPVDEWSALADDGSTTITIEGNVLSSADEDWYIISTTDDYSTDVSAGINYFNLEIELTEGSSTYEFRTYQTSYSSGGHVCSTSDAYTEFSWDQEDSGDGADHSIPSDDRYCGASGDASYNECSDFSDDWIVEVTRKSTATASCQHYELTINNGL